ncbi:MAG: HK97 gp10 family phage protein [Clostridiales bacterium]|nr:HK97 gp10 family phage protein [Clostridiales bacterium]
MDGIRIEWDNAEVLALEKKLLALSVIRLDAVLKKNITEIYNRAKSGGTPVDTGQLRQSASVSMEDYEMGYSAEYAPHVEYGHRTRGGGFVPGQYYLKKNVETQRPILIEDLQKAIEKELKKK